MRLFLGDKPRLWRELFDGGENAITARFINPFHLTDRAYLTLTRRLHSVVEQRIDRLYFPLSESLQEERGGTTPGEGASFQQSLEPTDTNFRQLAMELISDIEAVQADEDIRETWPDLWATYERACSLMGVEPNPSPSGESVLL